MSSLQGVGHSQSVAAEQETSAFVTATKPLQVWLHQRNFRFGLHAIQRDYEWRKTQVVG